MKQIVLFCLSLSILTVSCGKKAILRKYYIIEAPAEITETVSPDSTCYPVRVDVRDFQISKAIDQTRIALRTDTHELNYFFYHHWAVRPSAGVADMVYDIIARKNCFQRLVRGYSSRPEYLITGYIKNLERTEQGKQISAHLAATFELIDQESGNTMVRHEFDRTDPVAQKKSMNAFVEILNRILYEETGTFATLISAYYSQPSGDNR